MCQGWNFPWAIVVRWVLWRLVKPLPYSSSLDLQLQLMTSGIPYLIPLLGFATKASGLSDKKITFIDMNKELYLFQFRKSLWFNWDTQELSFLLCSENMGRDTRKSTLFPRWEISWVSLNHSSFPWLCSCSLLLPVYCVLPLWTKQLLDF